MSTSVKEVLSSDGSGITILSAGELSIIDTDAKCVGIQTHNGPEHEDNDELWIFKRKAFLKAVAKALNVAIYDTNDVADEAGYYR